MKVSKKSNKPFKSTFRTNTVKGIHPHPYRIGHLAFSFEEDDSLVSSERCVPIQEEPRSFFHKEERPTAKDLLAVVEASALWDLKLTRVELFHLVQALKDGSSKESIAFFWNTYNLLYMSYLVDLP